MSEPEIGMPVVDFTIKEERLPFLFGPRQPRLSPLKKPMSVSGLNLNPALTVSGDRQNLSDGSNNLRPKHRLLVALTAGEQKFLSLVIPKVIAEGGEVLWFDKDQPGADWEKTLRHFRPTLLVSGWSTPTLPEAYLTEPSCGLDYVCHIFGHIRHIVPRIFLERGGKVTNWGSIISHQVAEHALLLALGTLRNIKEWNTFIREQAVYPRPQAQVLRTQTLFEKKVGIHGFGRIARELVKLLKPFRVKLSAYSPGVPHDFIQAHEVDPCSSLEELFAEKDLIFECEALNDKTRNSISAEILSLLPDGAIFVNVGRGAVVDEEALWREASGGRIRVALDVVQDEPLTSASPFFPLPHALLSPHIAGPTNDRYKDCTETAMQNVVSYLGGQPLKFVVTLEDYDRAT